MSEGANFDAVPTAELLKEIRGKLAEEQGEGVHCMWCGVPIVANVHLVSCPFTTLDVLDERAGGTTFREVTP